MQHGSHINDGFRRRQALLRILAVRRGSLASIPREFEYSAQRAAGGRYDKLLQSVWSQAAAAQMHVPAAVGVTINVERLVVQSTSSTTQDSTAQAAQARSQPCTNAVIPTPGLISLALETLLARCSRQNVNCRQVEVGCFGLRFHMEDSHERHHL